MWPLGVVECYPILDDASGLQAVSDFFEIDRLLFQGAPQPLDKDVAEVTTPPIHRDAHPSFGQRRDPCSPGKLVAPISIYDLVQSWRVSFFGSTLQPFE